VTRETTHRSRGSSFAKGGQQHPISRRVPRTRYLAAQHRQLVAKLIDEVIEDGSGLVVRARTPSGAVACPGRGRPSERVHGYHVLRLADLPAAGRGVTVELRVRRLLCQTSDCAQRTFREQIPTLAQRWARRSRQLTALIATWP
jgi:transposase